MNEYLDAAVKVGSHLTRNVSNALAFIRHRSENAGFRELETLNALVDILMKEDT